jgi:quercetin dioxygenase-like cupin family protein
VAFEEHNSIMPASDYHPDNPREGKYPTEARFTLAEVPGLRVRQIGLAVGQCVPWHFHSEITDTFFCMQGPMCVRTRSPDAAFVLEAGDTIAVPPGRHHYAAGVDMQACTFMIVQGVGTYDYVPVED